MPTKLEEHFSEPIVDEHSKSTTRLDEYPMEPLSTPKAGIASRTKSEKVYGITKYIGLAFMLSVVGPCGHFFPIHKLFEEDIKYVESSLDEKSTPVKDSLLIRNSSDEVEFRVRTVPLADRDHALEKMSSLLAAAKGGEAEALALLGAADLNEARRYSTLCHASHRGHRVAMELLAGGIELKRFPSSDRRLDTLFWFSLAHPAYAKRQMALLNEGNDQAQAAVRNVEALRQLVAPPFTVKRYAAARRLLDLTEVRRFRYAIAEEFDQRLATLAPEERTRLSERLGDWRPDPSTCPALWR